MRFFFRCLREFLPEESWVRRVKTCTWVNALPVGFWAISSIFLYMIVPIFQKTKARRHTCPFVPWLDWNPRVSLYLEYEEEKQLFCLVWFFSWGIWILEAVPSDSLHLLYLNTSSAFVKFLLWLGNSCYWRRWGTFSSHSWRWNDLSGIIHKSLFLHLSHWNDLRHLVAQGLPPKIFPSLRLQIPKLPESL